MKNVCFLVFAIAILSCNKQPQIGPEFLGGGVLKDSSLYNPQKYLLSVSKPNPTTIEANKPVIITSHGYSASTFEWSEFRTWASNRSDFLISNVLLEGHGTTYEDFKRSTWKDWQASIKSEYNKLLEAGYRRINFVASSTSCTLLLDLIHSGFFNSASTTVHIFLVDPIIIPSNKMLSLSGIIGPVIGYVESNDVAGEEKFYYHYRPQETLQQLQNVLTTVRKELEDGITLPKNVYVKVYKSRKDSTADPVSAVLIYNGMKTSQGGKIDLQWIDSELHVYTRLNLVPNVTAKDRQNQLNTFQDIAAKVF